MTISPYNDISPVIVSLTNPAPRGAYSRLEEEEILVPNIRHYSKFIKQIISSWGLKLFLFWTFCSCLTLVTLWPEFSLMILISYHVIFFSIKMIIVCITLKKYKFSSF